MDAILTPILQALGAGVALLATTALGILVQRLPGMINRWETQKEAATHSLDVLLVDEGIKRRAIIGAEDIIVKHLPDDDVLAAMMQYIRDVAYPDTVKKLGLADDPRRLHAWCQARLLEAQSFRRSSMPAEFASLSALQRLGVALPSPGDTAAALMPSVLAATVAPEAPVPPAAAPDPAPG